MDTYGRNLRHVLDMESSNLRLSCIATHHSDARGTYFMTLNPTIFECERIETDRKVSDPEETSETKFASTK